MRSKNFWIFFNSERKLKGQRVPRKGGLPTSPMQNPELLKGTAACPRNTVAQKTMRHAEKVNKERPGYRCADDACTKAPWSPQTNGRKSQQKKELQVQAERVQERHFPYQAFCPQAPNGNSSSLAADFTSIKRWLGARDCQPQKGVAVQQKLPAQRHGLYMPQREPEPHQNLTFRSPARQVPRAAAHLAVDPIWEFIPVTWTGIMFSSQIIHFLTIPIFLNKCSDKVVVCLLCVAWPLRNTVLVYRERQV